MKLCYKEYSVKMTLGAIKKFKQHTDLDLWGLLLSFIDTYSKTKGLTALEIMTKLYSVCDFETASHAIHCLIEDKSVPLAEIQDGMFRVGWLPSDRDDDMSEPWPLIMVAMCHEIDKQMSMIEEVKKKADTSE